MKNFKKLLIEINEYINTIQVFNIFIKVTLFFLILFFILSLFNLYPIFSVVPTLMYLIILLYLNLNKSKAKIIENKYPALKEKLITSYDYRNVENPVVDELQEDVVQDMRSVKVSSFINQKKVAPKIFLIVLLSFIITIGAYFDITIVDVGSNLKKLKETPNIISDVLFSQEEFFEDIFGEESEIKFGTEELTVEIRPIGFEIDVRQLSEIPEEPFGENSFPQEVFIHSSESFQEDFSHDYSKLVKDYFEKMSKI